MRKTYRLLFFFFISNMVHAQYNNIKAGQLTIINQKFISAPNPLPFGKEYTSGDQYYIFEYDASKAILYGFTEDNNINSAIRYDVSKKDNSNVVIGNYNEFYDYLNMLNYHNSSITVDINIDSGLLSFSFFDKEFEKESLICTLKIIQMNFDVARLMD